MKTVKDAKYSFNHVKERLLERYDLTITEGEYRSLNRRLFDKDVVSIEEKQIVYKIMFKSVKILVTFCKDRGYITTVLPMRD